MSTHTAIRSHVAALHITLNNEAIPDPHGARHTLTPSSVATTLSTVSTRPSSRPYSMYSSPAGTKCRPTTRIVFGTGAIARLPSELSELRISRPLLISAPSCTSLARDVKSLILRLDCRITQSTLTEECIALASGHDAVISLGSARAIHIATDISIRKQIPHICIPSTYSSTDTTCLGDAGSCWSAPRDRRRSACRAGGRRYRGTSGRARPATIIYDETLTNTRPCIAFLAPETADSTAKDEDGLFRLEDYYKYGRLDVHEQTSTFPAALKLSEARTSKEENSPENSRAGVQGTPKN